MSKIGKAMGMGKMSMGEMDEEESEPIDNAEEEDEEKAVSSKAELMAMKQFMTADSAEAKVAAMKSFMEACGSY